MKNYLIPNKNNKYDPHIFQTKKMLSIFLLTLAIALLASIGNVILTSTGLLASIQSAFLVDLTNKDRLEENVSMLSINPVLVEAAQKKANDMAEKSYFAHTSPEGRTPWYWFEDVGYNYMYAGENLAVNFTESVDVHRAWLASPTHRQNILDRRFTEIGIATADGFYKGRKATFVVQMFGKPRFASAVSNALVVPQTIPITVSGPDLGSMSSNTEVQGVAVESNQLTSFASETNIIERVLVSPLSVSEIILSVVIGLLIIVLIIRIFVEFRHHHIGRVVLFVFLILGLCVVLYAQKNLFFGEVVLDPAAQEISN